MSKDRMVIPIAAAPRLTQSETNALFRLVVKRPAPAPDAEMPAAEGALLVAADLLKAHGFDMASVLSLMGRLWAWIEADDALRRVLMFNVVDRRYVGWHRPGKSVLVDMTTGEEIPDMRAIPCILESIAYNIYELLGRRAAIARGTRASIWEAGDAASQAPHGEAPEGRNGVGQPQVVRDDPGAPVP
jgi:hypothetical protein